jgi:aldose 1-epimerase
VDITVPDAERATLRAGELEAVFLPRLGMLGASLEHRGEQLLRRVDDLAAAAATGATAGIPFVHPYANRLASAVYCAFGKQVQLDPQSPLLNRDEQGLLIHGVRWSALRFDVVAARADRIVAQLDWHARELLAIFPFRHRVRIAVVLDPAALTVETTIDAEEALPVSFGFHPYVGLPGLARADWRLALPPMERLVLDRRRIPTGARQPFPALDRVLGDWDCDAGFAVGPDAAFALSGAGRRICLQLGPGYRYAQVFAPRARDFIALEPMTAPANALVSGDGLATALPGVPFRAAFRIRVEDDSGAQQPASD